MRIYLIRHGEKEREKVLNSDELPDMKLTQKGVRQAELTGKLLSGVSFDAIYSSDLVRANQTAAIISQYQEKPIAVTIDKRIREIDMGVLHTSTENEIRKKYPKFYDEFMKKDSDFRYPQGESGKELNQRTVSFFNSLDNTEMRNVCVVCHGGVIRALTSHYLGLPVHKRFNIHPDNCGVSILEYDVNLQDFRVITVNETLHLME